MESQAAEEKMKDANWEFTKEVCTALGNINEPSKELVNLATKFMIMVDQKEASWKLFKSLTKNYSPLKNLMDSMNVENMTESKLSELLPLWKNYPILHEKLQAEALGAEIILRWISAAVEFKIKKEALIATKAKHSELQASVTERLKMVIEKNVVLAQKQEKIQVYQRKINALRENNEKQQSIQKLKDSDDQFGKILSQYKEDPVISFSYGKKPEPKKSLDMSHQSPDDLIKRNKPKKEIKEADEYIDEQGNAIKLEAGDGGYCYCKAKISKYFCG